MPGDQRSWSYWPRILAGFCGPLARLAMLGTGRTGDHDRYGRGPDLGTISVLAWATTMLPAVLDVSAAVIWATGGSPRPSGELLLRPAPGVGSRGFSRRARLLGGAGDAGRDKRRNGRRGRGHRGSDTGRSAP